MAHHRQKAVEISERRRKVADRYLRGISQMDIAEELNINQATVSRDLAALIGEWRKSALVDINEAKAQELAKINKLEREYWMAWERSQRDAESSFTEKIEGEASRLKAQYQKEVQCGDPRYLQGVQWCINKRCEILALNAPQKLAGADGGPFVFKVVYEEQG